MRIIGGTAAGHVLKAPKGLDIRPTIERAKQAIFNSLGDRVAGATVLELFAGTGALGLESLSRGAVNVVFVEKSQRHAECLRSNLIAAHLPEKSVEIRIQDVFAVLRQLAANQRKFDLVLADPPYGVKNVGCRSESFAQQLLDSIELPNLLNENGLLVLGHTKRDTLDLGKSWKEYKTLKHGDSVMRFFKTVAATSQNATTPPESGQGS